MGIIWWDWDLPRSLGVRHTTAVGVPPARGARVSSTFLSELLDEYGRPLDRYQGSGTLANDTASATVEWAAAQYDDGQVLLACQGDTSTFDVMVSGPTRFDGTSPDGVTFDCRGDMLDLPFLRRVPSDPPGGSAVYSVGLLHADFPATGSPGLVRYLLTNFEFDRRGRQRTDLRLPGVEGVVRLLPDERDAHARDRLRVLRSPQPTAWLEIGPQDGKPVRAHTIANHVCDLLSVARGTKVAWIQEEVVNTNGVRTHLFHSHRITKPFSPLAPIDPTRVGGIPEFLEMTYPVYVKRREAYRFDKGTIDSVLDAKVQTDFLETRGAKLAVALEELKHNVLLRSSPGAGYHVAPDVFEGFVQEIADAVRAVLVQHHVADEVTELIANPQSLLSLNRRSFSHLLRDTAERIGLKLSSKNRGRFVQCRNSLVHLGEFYCSSSVSPELRAEVTREAKVEEYYFLLAVVDAFLLRLVGYTGPYLVRTLGEDGGEVREVRNLEAP
jgi:hypothetical protein